MGGGYRLLLVTIAVAMFLDGVDATIVNIALPDIAESFGITTGDTSWIVTIYYMMMSGLILIFGRLCDLGAIKKVLVIGMVVFTAGSLCCGLSPSFEILMVGRAIQGVGSAMVASSSVMLGVKFLPKEKLTLGMSLVIMGMNVGSALGPTLGAILTDYLSWHWVFFINVPIGALAVILATISVPTDKELMKGDVDCIGSVILFITITLGLFVIERIPSVGITSISLLALVLSLVAFGIFILYERGRSGPVLDLKLFRNRDFNYATLAYAFVGLGFMGVFYLLPFLLKKVLGLDTLESGLFISLQAVSMVIPCIFIGKWSEKHGDRIFSIISCVLMVIFSLMLLMIRPETSLIYVSIALIVMGLIWGIGGAPMGARMVNVLQDEDRGSGSSMVTFVMYFFAGVGTASFAGFFGLGSGTGTTPIEFVSTELFIDGFTFCMLICLVVAMLALVCSWILRSDERGSEGES